uniref:RNA polymerase sigma factor sigDic isoform X2 n=1 Tax=Rhizophora mucronata TaxID=61149 RepID=A0A2P2L057_RHIMU
MAMEITSFRWLQVMLLSDSLPLHKILFTLLFFISRALANCSKVGSYS